MNTPSVAVLLADGAEPLEVTAPVDAWRRGGVSVTLAALGNSRTVELAHGMRFDADALLAEVDLAQFDALFIPGGSVGVEHLLASTAALDAVRMFAEAGKHVFAICAGPMVMNAAGILEGRRVTCYPGCQEGFPARAYQGGGVVQDANLFTAAGPAYALELGLACLAALTSEEAARQVAADMLMA